MDGDSNTCGWLESNGDFSGRSAYELYTGTSDEGRWLGWVLIWKLRVHQRIKMFIWTLAHDRALTNFCRWRRRLVDSPGCGRCGHERENVTHTVRECPASKEVWPNTWKTTRIPGFYNSPLKEWLLQCLSFERRKSEDDSWPERFAIDSGSCGPGGTRKCLARGDFHYNNVWIVLERELKRTDWLGAWKPCIMRSLVVDEHLVRFNQVESF